MCKNQELISISPGNSKTGKIPAISLVPRKDCPKKCDYCYAMKAFRQYPRTRNAWTKNSDLARTNRPRYFLGIIDYCQKHAAKFFRYHVAGDILDQDYLDRMKTAARACPETKFLCFTKMHHLNFRNLPQNLTIVLSMDADMPSTRKRLPKAWMRDLSNPDKRIPSTAIHCPGNCESCGMCWQLPAIGKDVVFDKH